MIVAGLLQTAIAQTAAVVASSNAEGVQLLLFGAGPIAGLVLYRAVVRRYRNQDKTHVFEHETHIAISPIRGDDVQVDEVKGTRRRWIDGDVRDKHRVRVRRVP